MQTQLEPSGQGQISSRQVLLHLLLILRRFLGGFPVFVAHVAALAYAKSDLPSMARTSSVMLLPCAAISTGSRPWLRHNAQLRLGGSLIMRAVLTWLLATKRQQNIFCRQSLRRRRRVKRPLKTNAGYGPPIPSASPNPQLT